MTPLQEETYPLAFRSCRQYEQGLQLRQKGHQWMAWHLREGQLAAALQVRFLGQEH